MDFYNAFIVELATDLNYEFGRLDSPARVAIHFTHRLWALVVAAILIYFSFASFIEISSILCPTLSICFFDLVM